MRRPAALLVLAAILATTHVWASDPKGSKEHFEAGRAHVRAGHYELAVPEFRASIAAEPNVGATLNLGECLETMGRLAEAYESFRDAQSLAADRRDERVAVARTSAERVQAKLVNVVLRPPARAHDLVVRVDGATIPEALWGRVLVSTGQVHRFSASSPGCTWMQEASGRAGESLDLAIVLACDAPAPPPPPPSESPTAGSTQRTAGYAILGAGGLALVASGVLGVMTLSARSDLKKAVDADPRCSDYPAGSCDPSARSDLQSLEDRATGRATAATIVGVVGVAFMVSGLALVLLAPPLAARPTARSLGLGGSF